MKPLRLFVAIELDHPGRRSLIKLIDRLGHPPGKVRFVGPAQMHLTLNFIGDAPPERAVEIAEAMARAADGIAPFAFDLAGFGGFPNLRAPKVLWVGVSEPTGALLRLQAALTAELTALGIPQEDRPFSPHITLGRVKQLDRRADYQAIFQPHEPFAGPEQLAERLLLISSELGRQGPTYATVATVALVG